MVGSSVSRSQNPNMNENYDNIKYLNLILRKIN